MGRKKKGANELPAAVPAVQDLGQTMLEASEKKEREQKCANEVNEVLEKYNCTLGAQPVLDPKQVVGILSQLVGARPYIQAK